jgi:hypothetical protein
MSDTLIGELMKEKEDLGLTSGSVVHKLTQGTDYWIIGTNHILPRSGQLVKKVASAVPRLNSGRRRCFS